MDHPGRKQFLRFLAEHSAISADALVQIESATRGFREAPVAIALRQASLTVERRAHQLDALLSQKLDDGTDILGLAQQQAILSADSTARLRILQGLREIWDVFEVLILDGKLDCAVVERDLAAFLARHRNSTESERRGRL